MTCGIAVPASAQSLDAHGLTPPPAAIDHGAPLLSVHPTAHEGGSATAGLLFEYAHKPFVEVLQLDEGSPVVYPLVDHLVGANLTGQYALAERVSAGFTLPVWLGAAGVEARGGPTTGDLALWVPVGLLLPEDDGGFALSVALFADAPTGNGSRLLGDQRLGLGALVAGGADIGAVTVGANLGLEGTGAEAYENLTGGGAIRFGAHVGYDVSDAMTLHLETAGRMAESDSTTAEGLELDPGLASPVEVAATARGSAGKWTWAGGVATGITSGAGASVFRLYSGLGRTFGPTPEQLAPVSAILDVVDPDGAPVSGATLRAGDVVQGTTGSQGRVTAELSWRERVSVQADGYLTTQVPKPSDPLEPIRITMPWEPVQLDMVVRTQQGAPLAGQITVDGEVVSTDDLGGDTLAIPVLPGTREVSISAPGIGLQSRTFTVPVGGPPPSAEALLATSAPDGGSLALTVTDTHGAPVLADHVILDGLPLGSTGNGGTLTLADVAPGTHRLEVGARGYRTVEDRDVEVTTGGVALLPIVLRREPGSVKVRVTDPDGVPVEDATVRFDGPSRLAAAGLGDAGERIFQLSPGTWMMMVLSPSSGLQAREVVVPQRQDDLIVVSVVLHPAEDGDAELALRVVGPQGEPLADVAVRLDDKDYGTTSTGGSLTLSSLLPGSRTLSASGPFLRPIDPSPFDLVVGAQEKVLPMQWQPGTVRYRVRTLDGPVSDAVIRAVGPAPVDPLPLGTTGEQYASLGPGTWQILIVSPTAGLQQQEVTIEEDSTGLHRVDVILNPEGGGSDLLVSVRDPDGSPVSGAQVLVDGVEAGTASLGELGVKGLAAGQRQVTVTATPFAPWQRSVVLEGGEHVVDAALAWGTGAVRVSASTPEGPASDAIIRAAGPSIIPPAPVDADGRRLLALTPGTWQVLVISEQSGLAQRELVVEESPGLTLVDIEIPPVVEGTIETLVRVVDDDGDPIQGAEVWVDGTRVAHTGPAGTAILSGELGQGLAVEIKAPHRSPYVAQLTLNRGTAERIAPLPWLPQEVAVTVRDEAGNPVSAEVAFDGPADVPTVRAAADGRAVVAIRPGAWVVLASTDELGVGRQSLEVVPGAGQQAVDLTLTPAKVEVTTTAVVIHEKVHFDFDKATLKPDSDGVLTEVANTLLAHPGLLTIEVQGHTDGSGDVAYNLELSTRRALAVRDALVERGVAPERLVARGYGPTRPRMSNDDPEGAAMNRRVEFDILETAESN